MRKSENTVLLPSEHQNLDDNARTPRFAIVGSEMVIVAAIIGALTGILFPAVEAARDTNGTGPLLPNLMWLHQHTFPAPSIALASLFSICAYGAFHGVRRLAPKRVLKYLPWWQRR